MKSFIRPLILLCTLLFASGLLMKCYSTSEIAMAPNTPVQVLKGARTVRTEERNLTKIGLLDDEGRDLLKKYLASAKSQRAGFVISDYYLQIDSRIIGVVESSTGELTGLDVTTGNASHVPVTTTHTLLVGKDTDVAARLLKHIKEAKFQKDAHHEHR